MRRTFAVLFAMILGAFFVSTSFAAPPQPIKSGFGVVVVLGAQIYEKPDLDAPVLTVAKQGDRIPLSKGTRGEFAKFYRTRVNGKIGWILVLDVRSEAEAKKIQAQAKAAAYKSGPFARKIKKESEEGDEDEFSKKGEPFAFKRHVSFAIGMMEYKESINGGDYSANLLTYGIKLTGPDVFLTGPIMDVNILFHYGAPDYYTRLSATKPAALYMWMDANLLLPVYFKHDTLVGLGAGPVLIVSNVQASQGAEVYDMWQMNLGVDLEATVGVRWGDVSFRLEGKYIFEKKTYRQVQLAVGTEF